MSADNINDSRKHYVRVGYDGGSPRSLSRTAFTVDVSNQRVTILKYFYSCRQVNNSLPDSVSRLLLANPILPAIEASIHDLIGGKASNRPGLLRTVWFPISGSLISHIATPTTATTAVCIYLV